MSDTKLRCCPFCGGEARLNYFGSGHIPYYQISCSECGCRQASSIHKESVISTWNTRKPIDRIVEQLEEESNKYCSPRHLDCEGCGYYALEEAIGIVKAGGIDEMVGKDV